MLINVVKYLDCCTLSLEIIVDVYVEPALGNKHWIFNKLFFEDTPENKSLVITLLKGISSPTIHAPSYNHKTRNAIYRIYQAISLSPGFLSKVGHPVDFISAVLSAIENESDPRSLVISFDLMAFMLQTYITK
jgi:hypothetical protein